MKTNWFNMNAGLKDLVDQGTNTNVSVGTNVTVVGSIQGNNNKIIIGDSKRPSILRVHINGDRNSITIGNIIHANKLYVSCGNHIASHDTSLKIGHDFSVGENCRIYLHTSGNRLAIGDDCQFSFNITIRCGESPHLLFDLETGEFLDKSEGVFVGNHVWVGEQAYITKSVTIPDGCVVGACSVVTRRFDEQNVAIAGNPARVVRRGIKWERGRSHLEPGSKYASGYRSFHAKFSS